MANHEDALFDTSARSARWIETPDEQEDRAGQTLATRTHEVIRQWAEARGARPAVVEGSGGGDRVGVLRLAFPGDGGKGLTPIPWEAWLAAFDERNLVFLFRQHAKDGSRSNFCKLQYPGDARR